MAVASTHVASAGARSIRPRGVDVSPVAWMPDDAMDYAGWVAAGSRLGSLGRYSQWWLGDWIRFGTVKFGERYARAARITGYDVQTLTNMVYVATRFEISRRRENLTWSHHETLASLDPDQQDRWLERAIAERLSVSDLRSELRSAQRTGAGTGGSQPSLPRARKRAVVTCPECGCKIVASKL